MQSNYIPNIDLSEIIDKDFNSDAAIQISKNIKKASEDIGFFTVTNHGIPISKIDNLLKTCKKFFYLDEEEKLKIAPKKWNPNTNTVYRGYFPSSVNGKEGLDIGDPLLKQNMVDLLKKEKFEVNHDMSFLDPDWQITINNYFDDPININMTNGVDLEDLGLLTDVQVSDLLLHRKLHGKFISIYELQSLTYWDMETIYLLLPFILSHLGFF